MATKTTLTLQQAYNQQVSGTWPTTWYGFIPSQRLWTWGQTSGLGDGAANRSSPANVGSIEWIFVASTNYGALAIKAPGTLWAWGTNSNGQLGLGDTVTRVTPTQVGTLSGWASIKTDASSGVLAIKTDGTLWSWGRNEAGRLGQGDTIYRSSPVQVGALTDWASVALGFRSGHGIKTDGTLWSWGHNGNYGQLGDGTLISRSSPIQVGSDTNWSSVDVSQYTVNAIKTGGTLWAWGSNAQGQLGQGDTISRSSPTQVGALTNWSKISISANAIGGSVAIKTDGTLWAWGGTVTEILGLGGTTPSSPSQVGLLTNWSTINAHGKPSLAIKTDGTLWVWGNGFFGGLGLGNTNNINSPVQIGALTNWLSVASGGYNSIALSS